MSKRKQKNDPRQMTIDDHIARLSEDHLPAAPVNGSANIHPQLRGIINEIIRESGLSRAQIAEEMNIQIGLASGEITEATINSWTRGAEPRHIPLENMYALEQVCESREITKYFCKLHDGKFIDRRSNNILDLGQLQVLKTQLAVREKELKRELAR